jgi:hypothetical protein
MIHCYEFAAPAGRFGVRSAVDLADTLQLQAGRWPWAEVAALENPKIEIERSAGGSLLRLRVAEDVTRETANLFDATSGTLDMLTRLTMEQLGPYALLHAGSAIVDGALVAFPGRSLAGKSTLALQLAARGHLLGGDDRLLIGPLRAEGGEVEGVLLGLNARVRLPIDPRAGERFSAFVAARRLPMPGLSERLAFVAPHEAEMAPYGRRQRLAALILPQRREDGGVALEPAPISDIMRLLLEEFFAPHWPAAELTAAARAVAQVVPRFALRFDNSAQAAALVEKLVRSGFRDGTG